MNCRMTRWLQVCVQAGMTWKLFRFESTKKITRFLRAKRSLIPYYALRQHGRATPWWYHKTIFVFRLFLHPTHTPRHAWTFPQSLSDELCSVFIHPLRKFIVWIRSFSISHRASGRHIDAGRPQVDSFVFVIAAIAGLFGILARARSVCVFERMLKKLITDKSTLDVLLFSSTLFLSAILSRRSVVSCVSWSQPNRFTMILYRRFAVGPRPQVAPHECHDFVSCEIYRWIRDEIRASCKYSMIFSFFHFIQTLF